MAIYRQPQTRARDRRNGPHLDQQGSCRRFLSGSPAAPHIAGEALPGQFVNLKVNAGVTPFLRMPLSVCDVNPDAGYIDVLYQEAGPKTQALCKQPIGEELSCLGPLGHPFTHPDKGTDCVLVGGGIGVPPMIFLGRRLMREGLM